MLEESQTPVAPPEAEIAQDDDIDIRPIGNFFRFSVGSF